MSAELHSRGVFEQVSRRIPGILRNPAVVSQLKSEGVEISGCGTAFDLAMGLCGRINGLLASKLILNELKSMSVQGLVHFNYFVAEWKDSIHLTGSPGSIREGWIFNHFMGAARLNDGLDEAFDFTPAQFFLYNRLREKAVFLRASGNSPEAAILNLVDKLPEIFSSSSIYRVSREIRTKVGDYPAALYSYHNFSGQPLIDVE